MKHFPRNYKSSSGIVRRRDYDRILIEFAPNTDLRKQISALDDLELELDQGEGDLRYYKYDYEANKLILVDKPKTGDIISHSETLKWAISKDRKSIPEKTFDLIKEKYSDIIVNLSPVYYSGDPKRKAGLGSPRTDRLFLKLSPNINKKQKAALFESLEELGLKYNIACTLLMCCYLHWDVLDSFSSDIFYLKQKIEKNFEYVQEVSFANRSIAQAISYTPNDPPFTSTPDSVPWNLETAKIGGVITNNDYAWDVLPSGKMIPGNDLITIAVIDIGVKLDHEDLVSNFIAPGFNADTCVNDASTTTNTHGTKVAGIVGASHNNELGLSGVGAECKILPIKISTSQDDEIARAIKYAADHGAKVINMSFGSYIVNDEDPIAPDDDLPGVLRDWNLSMINCCINYAYNKGVLMVAATGNADRGLIHYPARHPLVMGIGSSNQDDHRLTGSGGSNYSLNQNPPAAISVVAPGIEIYTTAFNAALDDTYLDFEGTSAAAPHVAGLAGLIFSINPNLHPDEVRDYIECSADKVHSGTAYSYLPNFPNGTWSREMGYGRINGYEACIKARESTKLSIKDIIDNFKELLDGPIQIKEVYEVISKGRKEIYEVPGFPQDQDPFFAQRFEKVNEQLELIRLRLAKMEDKLYQGRSFIPLSDRPDVGEDLLSDDTGE